jgi:hypothetical protein
LFDLCFGFAGPLFGLLLGALPTGPGRLGFLAKHLIDGRLENLRHLHLVSRADGAAKVGKLLQHIKAVERPAARAVKEAAVLA